VILHRTFGVENESGGKKLTQADGGLFLPEPTASLMISILRIRGETTGCLITLRRFGQEGAAARSD